MISSGMRVCTRSQLGEATSALPTAPVEVVHSRSHEAQIYLTLALGISIYRREFRTVRKSLALGIGWASPNPRARPCLLARAGVASASAAGAGLQSAYKWRDVVELNTRGRYAVTAMADLARYGGGGALALSTIAERQQISLSYLEQLFLKLRRAGLVESARGRSGGYRLGRAANTITVGEVMAAVEEDIRMTRCNGAADQPCLPGQRCLTHGLWDALGDQIAAFLHSVTLKEVIDGIPAAKQAVRIDRSRSVPFGLASE